MKVTLIDYTGAGSDNPERHAAQVLIFTKNTRLQMNAEKFGELEYMNWDYVIKELEYMANTIPSSWEFVHYTFAIEGVTRACTHQMVRTRTASFAQQSMRVTDMSGFKYLTPGKFKDGRDRGEDGMEFEYDSTMHCIQQGYSELLKRGAEEEDARGVLPTNILTNIVGCYNLRTLSELVRSREGGRTQDEYREVVRAIGAAVLEVHPWASLFLYPKGRDYWLELEEAVASAIPGMKDRAAILKIIDKMRKQ